MEFEQLEALVSEAVQAFVKEPMSLGAEGEPFVTIKSKKGHNLELVMEDGYLDFIFHPSGMGIDFPKPGAEKEFLKEVLNVLSEIFKEKKVAISYYEKKFLGLEKHYKTAMIFSTEIEKYKTKLKFTCKSWNDTYSVNLQTE